MFAQGRLGALWLKEMPELLWNTGLDKQMSNQMELLREEEPKPGWKVVKVINRQFGRGKWPIYIKTQSPNWIDPQPVEGLPWEQ